MRDGNYEVHCTIHNVHGIGEQEGVFPLQVKAGRGKVVISTTPGSDTPVEYLDVALNDVHQNTHPMARANFMIPEPLDGGKLKTLCSKAT